MLLSLEKKPKKTQVFCEMTDVVDDEQEYKVEAILDHRHYG